MLEAILFPLAALLYAAAIVGEHVQHRLKKWSVRIFATALTLDATATFVVCVLKAKSLSLDFHALMGLTALGIMALHFTWALIALRVQGRAMTLFHRWSPWAFGVWMIAFVSGIPR